MNAKLMFLTGVLWVESLLQALLWFSDELLWHDAILLYVASDVLFRTSDLQTTWC